MWLTVTFCVWVVGAGVTQWRTLRAGALLSLASVAWAAMGLFLFIVPFLKRPEYADDFNFNAILLAGFAGLWLASFVYPVDGVARVGAEPRRRVDARLLWSGTIAYGVFCAWKILGTVREAGGVRALFSLDRVGLYLSERYLEGSSLADLFAQWGLVLLLITCAGLWRRGWWTAALLVYALPVGLLVFTANTRFGTTILLLSLITFVIDRRVGYGRALRASRAGALALGRFRRRQLRSAVLTGMLLLTLAIGYGVVGSAVRGGWFKDTRETLSVGVSELVLSGTLRDLQYYGYLHDLYDAMRIGRVSPDYGQAWFIYSAIGFVPRVLWREKPIVATGPRLTELIVGKLGAGEFVRTYTIFGEGYWQFAYVGAFVAPLLFLGVFHLAMRLIRWVEDGQWLALQLMYSSIPFLRSEIPLTNLGFLLVFLALCGSVLSARIEPAELA